MDEETARALAGIRERLTELESALGVSTPHGAEGEVARLRREVRALVTWGVTVTPPFTPPAS